MWKYNKYDVGDIVRHKKADYLEFIVDDVLCSAPEKKGEYLYSCNQLNGFDKRMDKMLKYHERDLYLIRKADISELNRLLQEALRGEEYEKASQIQHRISEYKN